MNLFSFFAFIIGFTSIIFGISSYNETTEKLTTFIETNNLGHGLHLGTMSCSQLIDCRPYDNDFYTKTYDNGKYDTTHLKPNDYFYINHVTMNNKTYNVAYLKKSEYDDNRNPFFVCDANNYSPDDHVQIIHHHKICTVIRTTCNYYDSVLSYSVGNETYYQTDKSLRCCCGSDSDSKCYANFDEKLYPDFRKEVKTIYYNKNDFNDYQYHVSGSYAMTALLNVFGILLMLPFLYEVVRWLYNKWRNRYHNELSIRYDEDVWRTSI